MVIADCVALIIFSNDPQTSVHVEDGFADRPLLLRIEMLSSTGARTDEVGVPIGINLIEPIRSEGRLEDIFLSIRAKILSAV